MGKRISNDSFVINKHSVAMVTVYLSNLI